jgi:outer membrane protein assembly factor BamB
MDTPSLRRRVTLGILALLSVAATGWRFDGTSVRADARPPMSWSADHRVWSASLPSWSNASPVAVGSQILVEAEPTTLLAVDAASGRVLWRVTNDYVDTLAAADRPAFQARVDALPGYQQALKEAVSEVSRLRKLARSADAPADTSARIQAFTSVMDALKSQIDALAPYITPPDKDIIGYSSATPVSDGQRAYALFGQGVVSAVDLSGRKLWTTWLGKAPRPMRGYDFGSVASPLLVDGLLIVAHKNLVGLDPATGRVVWTGPEWRHYGTPAVLYAGGYGFLIAPDGRAYRAVDGALVARDMADLWYTGPSVSGDTAYWVGGFGHENSADNTRAVAWRLTADGSGGLSASKLWERPIASGNRIYAPSVIADGLLYVSDAKGNSYVLDAASGADVTTVAPPDSHLGTVFAPPQVVGSHFVMSTETGAVVFGTAGRTWTLEAQTSAGAVSRATPLFVGDKAYVRSAAGLACYR